MGMSSNYSHQYLLLIFNAVGIPNIADNAASSPLTNFYVALHSADPTATGNQSTNEIAYTTYARVAVARTAGGWTVTNNAVSPVANIAFPVVLAGNTVATFWSVGELSVGLGEIIYSGPISPNITIAVGVVPELTTTSTITQT